MNNDSHVYVQPTEAFRPTQHAGSTSWTIKKRLRVHNTSIWVSPCFLANLLQSVCHTLLTLSLLWSHPCMFYYCHIAAAPLSFIETSDNLMSKKKYFNISILYTVVCKKLKFFQPSTSGRPGDWVHFLPPPPPNP